MTTTTTRRNLLRIGTTAAAYAAGATIVTGGVAIASQAKGAEAPTADRSAWDAALRHFEAQADAYRASMDAFGAAETRLYASDTPATSKAYDTTRAAMLDRCGDSCNAVRALVAVPAPDAAAALIKAQIALDSGQHTDDDLAAALAADLRRFTRYANQEA